MQTRETAAELSARRVGIIGGGQLGRMLAHSGADLGLEFCFLDPSDTPSAAPFGAHLKAAFDDPSALLALAERSDVLTYEFENVSVESLRAVAASTPVYPPVEALEMAQERSQEKVYFKKQGIPVAEWAYADSQHELDAALQSLGLPVIVKTNRLGYDGKGQHRVQVADDAKDLYARMGAVPLCVERFVDFDYEVSAIGVRDKVGTVRHYALTRNEHRGGILHRSTALTTNNDLSELAREYFQNVANALSYVGVLAIEFFVKGSSLIANECAPRVHNSGHWTIEGAVTSQFENHVRAVSGLPLGSTRTQSEATMENFIGEMPDREALLGIDGLGLHDYGKSPRPGRKLGHATIVANDRVEMLSRLRALEAVASRSVTCAVQSNSQKC